MITIKHYGNFTKTSNFLNRITRTGLYSDLHHYGELGVLALSAATPRDSGKTADSWYYDVETTNTGISLVWKNRNISKYIPVAILIQYGHGLENGGYVQGIDFINPALKPIFKDISDSVWRDVHNS